MVIRPAPLVWIDVVASNGKDLDQEEFNKINNGSLEIIVDQGIEYEDWIIKDKGINAYGLWYAAGNQKTLENFKRIVPTIEPPPKKDGSPAGYTFVCYGPGEKPCFNLKLRVSVCFENTKLDTMNKGLKLLNPEIRKVTLENGETRDSIIRITKRIHEKERDKRLDGSGKGNISFAVEAEERLWMTLVKECKGTLRLGTGEGKLEGQSIQAQVRRFLEGKEVFARGQVPEEDMEQDPADIAGAEENQA